MVSPSPPEPSALRALQAIQVLTDALDAMHSELSRQMSMHTSDLRALRMLAIREQQGEPVTPRAIAEHLAITTAAATALTDRLVRDGFAERTPHPQDGRSRIVTLTPKARQQFFSQFGGHLQTMRAVIESTEQADLTAATTFLEALAAGIATAPSDDPSKDSP